MTEALGEEWPPTTFVFGLRQGGRRSIIRRLIDIHEIAAVPLVHEDDAYQGHLLGHTPERPPRNLTPEEVRTAVVAKNALRLVVGFEDYPYLDRAALPLYRNSAPNAPTGDTIILRDWPGTVADRLRLAARQQSAGEPTIEDHMPWPRVTAVWQEYAKIMAEDKASGPLCISYNRWIAEPGYQARAAARLMVGTANVEIEQVPQSRAIKDRFRKDGEAAAMAVVNQWRNADFTLWNRFAELCATSKEISELNLEVFGFTPSTVLAELVLQHTYGQPFMSA